MRRFAIWAPLLLSALAVPVQDASAITSEPRPRLARSFLVAEVSGKVFVRPAGAARFSRLTKRRTIPVGSTVNATKGRVRLVAAVGGERRVKGIFWDGAFVPTQARRTGLIDLRLAGGSFAGCDGAEARASGLSRRRIRRLWGKARGRFRTRGNHSAATVRGTEWLTEDRCSSTVVTTVEGEVEATAGTTSFTLDSGDIFEVLCDPPLAAGSPLRYCVATLNNLQNGLFALGLATAVHDGYYTLCIDPPSGGAGDLICRDLPIPAEPDNWRVSVAGCSPDRGPGTYTVTWAWQGQLLGTLPVEVINPRPPGEGRCPVTFDEIP